MSTLTLRTESLDLLTTPASGRRQIDTPLTQGSAKAGSEPISTEQKAAAIGDAVPVVFGRRIGGTGGVFVSPPATELRFTFAGGGLTIKMLLVLSEGQINPIQVRDVFRESCRVGSLTQAYDRRAGSWLPGNLAPFVAETSLYCGTGGSYAGMSTGSYSITIGSPFEWNRQVHVFVRGGIWVPRLLESNSEGPSNNLADLVLWLLRRSNRIPDDLIDLDSMLLAAQFLNAAGLFCNIEIKEPSNLNEWLSNNLPYFLLRESRDNGKRGLKPLLVTNSNGSIRTGSVAIKYVLTEDHVIPGSFAINYTSRADRAPFCVKITWRQQPNDGPGIARISEVRYAGSAPDGPYEQHDLSEFCTTEDHAFKVGAYILATRRYVDHRLSLRIRPGGYSSTLNPGDIVRVRLTRTPSVGEVNYHDFLYQIDSIGRTATGEVSLNLTHFPVDGQGRSLVALDVSAAQGNGSVLSTGRAAVSCDINSSADNSVLDDDGPPEGADVPDADPPIGEGGEDAGDGWGEGSAEYESDAAGLDYNPDTPAIIDWPEDAWELDPEDGKWDYIDDPDDDWEWNREEQKWEYVGDEDPSWVWNEQDNEWQYVGDADPDWEWQWSENEGKWEYAGAIEDDWAWNAKDQEWNYVGADDANWTWNEGTQQWEYTGTPSANWSWDEEAQEWEYTGTPSGNWTWDQEDQKWDYVGTAIPDWTWDRNAQDWVYTGSASPVPPKPAMPPSTPPSTPPSEVPAEVPAENPPSPAPPAEPTPDVLDAYTGTLSFTEPLVRYPDVFYLYAQPGFASARFRVLVDNPPVDGPLVVRVTDGQGIYSLTIPEESVESEEIRIGANGDFFNTGCTTRTLTINGWEGGGYTGPVAMDTTGTESYEVCSYTGTVTMLDPGYWLLNDGDWEWIGAEVTDWSFNVGTQQWTYTGADDPAPPIPHPLPTTTPPGAGYLTMVVGAQVDNMPIPNPPNDLELTLSDGSSTYGTLTIPAVLRGFDVNAESVIDGVTQFWEYNPANGQWAYRNPPVNWRWHSSLGEWQWLASSRDIWAWNTEAEGWESIGGDNGSWTWDVEAQEWEWTGEGSPDDNEPDGPPMASPPTNGGSTFPPDASQWTWDPDEYRWNGSAYSLTGSPPVQEWKAYKTLHFIGSVD